MEVGTMSCDVSDAVAVICKECVDVLDAVEYYFRELRIEKDGWKELHRYFIRYCGHRIIDCALNIAVRDIKLNKGHFLSFLEAAHEPAQSDEAEECKIILQKFWDVAPDKLRGQFLLEYASALFDDFKSSLNDLMEASPEENTNFTVGEREEDYWLNEGFGPLKLAPRDSLVLPYGACQRRLDTGPGGPDPVAVNLLNILKE